jgi:para-nitrobenzyl esterase
LRLLLQRDRRARSAEEAAAVAAAMSPEQVRDYLRSQSARRILSCYPAGVFGMIDNPSLLRDGSVLPPEGFRSWEAGTPANAVPLVIGTNRDEVKIFMAFDRTQDWRSEGYRASARYGSDRWKADSVDAVARRITASTGERVVFAYRFDWGAERRDGGSVLPGDWGRRLGAFHSLEIPFFLGTDTVNGVMGCLLYRRDNEPGRKALSRLMMSYIGRFIRTGDPNGVGLPIWEAWSNELGGPKTLLLDADLDATRLEMSTVEYSAESVEAMLREEFAGEIVGAVLSAPRMIRSDFEE